MGNDISTILLDWYDRHHRDFPWRVTPGERKRGIQPSAYHVWLSEIMLQQTTVQAVRPYFLKFIEKWPTVTDLSAEADEEIMKAWAGLGYYSRARNLKKCAERIVLEHESTFPEEEGSLKKLPGIGDYTAAAIAAIAFDRPAAVVDGNIERVAARLWRISEPLPGAKKQIREKISAITPVQRPGDFAQAMMDLGATICTPKRPACGLCPINTRCALADSDEAERFPFKPPKKEKPVRRGAAFVASDRDDAILLRKRNGSGLLAGMTEVPTSDWTARQDGALGVSAAPFSGNWIKAGTVKHVFTHFELRLDVYHAEFHERPDYIGGWWSARQEVFEEALPTVMKKAITAAIDVGKPVVQKGTLI
ncbi:MAG: A/G-specific adenine glycosylase [Pseudomonadota bacterium]